MKKNGRNNKKDFEYYKKTWVPQDFVSFSKI